MSLVLGAVAYDPKVVTIWEGFRAWFAERDFAFDFVLYSNYERQVAAHIRGDVDIAWNSPLAWIQTRRIAERLGREAKAVCMRDTDQDLTSVFVVRADSGIRSLEDVRGKVVSVGAKDSPQATMIPLQVLREAGLEPGEDFDVRYHDRLVGKHGDHIGGERLAAKDLVAGGCDVACMIDGNHLAFLNEGTLPGGATRILAATGLYDHCCYTVLDDADPAVVERFVGLLLEQSYDDPEVRPLLDLEGLKAWKPGRTEGFGTLERACDASGDIDAFVNGF